MTAAIGYVRQSEARKGETDRTSLSLEAQESEIAAFAERSGLVLVDVVRDHDLKGDNPNRPGLIDLVKKVNAGVAPAVIVHKWDRFARDLLLQEGVIRPLEARGVRFLSVTEPGDRLSRVMFGGLAEYNRIQLGDRIGSAFRARARRGLWHGPAPYGYRKIPVVPDRGRPYQVLQPDPDLVAWVELIYARFLAGLPLWTIANELNALGAPTGRGAAWAAHAVKHVLTNPVYCGDVRYAGEIVARDAHPAIIGRADWDAAQAVIARRVVVRRTPRDYASWCEGLVRHSCGQRMYLTGIVRHDQTKPPIPSFGCRSAYAQTVRRCDLPRRHVVVSKLEPAVHACLVADLAGALSLDDAVAGAQRAAGGVEAERIRRDLAKRRAAAEHRHARARERWLAGREPMEWMDGEDARLAAELAAVEAESSALPAAPDPERFAATAAALGSMRGALALASPDALRRVLEAMGEAVVDGRGVRVAYRADVAPFVPTAAVTPIPR